MVYLNQWEPQDTNAGMVKVLDDQSVDCGPAMSRVSCGSLLEMQNPRSQPRPKDLHFTKIPHMVHAHIKPQLRWLGKSSPLAEILFLSVTLSDLCLPGLDNPRSCSCF